MGKKNFNRQFMKEGTQMANKPMKNYFMPYIIMKLSTISASIKISKIKKTDFTKCWQYVE